jgi:hypothetical protein
MKWGHDDPSLPFRTCVEQMFFHMSNADTLPDFVKQFLFFFKVGKSKFKLSTISQS